MFCTFSGDNHLSAVSRLIVSSFPHAECPYQFWVSSLWGLPVPLQEFLLRLVSVALLKVLIPFKVRSQPSPVRVHSVMVSAITITTDITVCASMDFPNPLKASSIV